MGIPVIGISHDERGIVMDVCKTDTVAFSVLLFVGLVHVFVGSFLS
jgi:hypothetical protein